MKRNGKIELLRFVFATLNVLVHYRLYVHDTGRYFRFAALGVDFFFVLSGFLMTGSLARESGEGDIVRDTMRFLKRKVMAFLPAYIPSCLIVYLASGIFNGRIGGFRSLASYLLQGLPGFLTLSDLTVTRMLPIVNGVTWFLAVMLLAMAVLYPLSRRSSLFRQIGAPLTGLFMLGYLMLNFNTLVSPRSLALGGLVYKGYVRGFCEICLGMLSYQLTHELIDRTQLTGLGKACLKALELAAFLLIIYAAVLSGNGAHNFYALIMIIILIALTFSRYALLPQLFNNRLCIYLGRLSLTLYMTHFAVINYFRYCSPAFFVRLAIRYQLLIVLGLSFLLAAAVDWLAGSTRIRNVIRKLLIREEQEKLSEAG